MKEKDEGLFSDLSGTFKDEDIWVIDSGASCHMTCHSKQLKTLSKINILRYDNGGEYTSKEIIAFCKEYRINRELIVTYNPEKNGVAEWKNRSIEESVKEMLHDQYLPKFMWGEATKIVFYIQNRIPHRSLNKKTLEEVFIGKKSFVDHLWTFGFPVYIHIPKEKRNKFDPSGMKGTFVGYSNSSKTYRIYIKEVHHIEFNSDVIFDE